ncbi:hypothetical protein ENBRE01_0726 [Enteropsectra breve]|nr:hypothetical protein ENBRE01_0726 [Enteropsectra breve]
MEASETKAQMCRFCHLDEKESEETLRHPCKCRGSLRYIHNSCLLEWLSEGKPQMCELCNFVYKFEKVYKEDAPQKVPRILVAKEFFKSAGSSTLYFFKILYIVFKYIAAYYTNKNILSYFINDSKWKNSTIFGIAASLLAFSHIFIYNVIRKTVQAYNRPRINVRETIDAMNADIMSRETSSMHNQEQEDFLEPASVDDDSLEDLEDPSEVNAYNPAFIWQIGSPLSEAASFLRLIWPVIFTVLINILKNLNVLPVFTLINSHLVHSVLFLLRIEEMASFINESQCYYSLSVINTLISLSLTVLSALKISEIILERISVGTTKLKELVAVSKFYIFSIAFPISIFYIEGLAIHASFAYYKNGSLPVFTFKNVFLSFVIHSLAGLFVSQLKEKIYLRYAARLRKGLGHFLYFRESTRHVVIYIAQNSFATLFKNMSLKIMKTIFLIKFCAYALQGLYPQVAPKDYTEKLLFVKMALWIFFDQDTIANIYVKVAFQTVHMLSKILRMDNFLFNAPLKKITKAEIKNNLCWDVNTNAYNDEMVTSVIKINKVVKDASELFICENEEKESAKCMQTEHDTTFGTEQCASMASCTKQELKGISRYGRKYKISEDDEKILQKYFITEKRITKYLGQKHFKKYSIFYKPNYFKLRLLIIAFAKTLSGVLCTTFLFGCASLMARFSGIKSGSAFLVAFVLLSKALCFVINDKKNRLSLSKLMKNAVMELFLSLVWPGLSSLAFVFLNSDENRMVRFSETFMGLSCLDFVTKKIMRTFFAISPMYDYTWLSICKKLSLFVLFQIVLGLLYYSQRVVWSGLKISMMMGIVVFIGAGVKRAVESLVSGKVAQQVKDKHWLSKTEVRDFIE